MQAQSPPARRGNDREVATAMAVARTIREGFARHYGLFRYHAQMAKARFEAGDFHGIRRLARERITFYDQRVLEAIDRLKTDFGSHELDEAIWQRVKRDYVSILERSVQPALAETFYNSVCCKILHRTYFNNDFIFVRPAVATDYLDSQPPSYRSYYPEAAGWRNALREMVVDFGLACPFADIDRDLNLLNEALQRHLTSKFKISGDCQFNVLRSLFFRNKAAYIIGRLVNDGEVTPISVPLHLDSKGCVYLDAALFGTEQLEA